MQLSSSVALDAALAGDSTHYNIAINGVVAAVQSASHDAANDTVTLKLAPGTVRSGDEVTVIWWGLRDKQHQPLTDGQQMATAR